MHGVPQNLDLSPFIGATLIQLCLGEFQIQFRFHPECCGISVEGYRLHVILGKTVEGYAVNPPRSFSLRFETGHLLTVFDGSEQYESFSISPGGIYV